MIGASAGAALSFSATLFGSKKSSSVPSKENSDANRKRNLERQMEAIQHEMNRLLHLLNTKMKNTVNSTSDLDQQKFNKIIVLQKQIPEELEKVTDIENFDRLVKEFEKKIAAI